MTIHTQDPRCSDLQLACVNTMKSEATKCLKPCSGLHVISFSAKEPTYDFEEIIGEDLNAYYQHINWFPVAEDLKG